MGSPTANVLPSSPIAVWRLPVLGVLLTGISVVLLAVRAGDMLWPGHSASSMASATRAGETMPSRVAGEAPTRPVESRPRGGVESDAGAVILTADLVEADDIDFVPAALYGPPDRQLQPTLEARLEEGSPNGGRGRARDYLEETAAARWLAPRYLPLLAWDETSGYGAVEAIRAVHDEIVSP